MGERADRRAAARGGSLGRARRDDRPGAARLLAAAPRGRRGGEAPGPVRGRGLRVPRAQLPELLRAVREISRRRGLTAICYGHAADGNIHVNVVQPPGERDRWLAERDAAVEEIFRSVVGLGGTITGEHGVGLTQRAYLSLRHPPEVIAAMRAVKEIFDPEGILNPGKIFAHVASPARSTSTPAGPSGGRTGPPRRTARSTATRGRTATGTTTSSRSRSRADAIRRRGWSST